MAFQETKKPHHIHSFTILLPTKLYKRTVKQYLDSKNNNKLKLDAETPDKTTTKNANENSKITTQVFKLPYIGHY